MSGVVRRSGLEGGQPRARARGPRRRIDSHSMWEQPLTTAAEAAAQGKDRLVQEGEKKEDRPFFVCLLQPASAARGARLRAGAVNVGFAW